MFLFLLRPSRCRPISPPHQRPTVKALALTPGAMEVCHDRYVQLRMLHENNDKGNNNRSRS